MNKRNIAIFSGTRAEYGLLKYLIKGIENDKNFILNLIITGSHLSSTHGTTVDEILSDGIRINHMINILSSDDTKSSTTEALGKLIQKLAIIFEKDLPDLLIILGDRYELIGAASAAKIFGIPIAHIHGGEITEGSLDEIIRHSITKMSDIHFVANEVYKKRIIQMGENPEKVFNVGGLGVDAIKKTKLMKKNILEKSLGLKFNDINFLITFHPNTENINADSEFEIREILKALAYFENAIQIFTLPNADPGNKSIINSIKHYVNNNGNAYVFKSLGQVRYLSCLSFVDLVIGNSSSGLLEAPSLKTATINIGDRQKGRLLAESVLNSEINSDKIVECIKNSFSVSFQEKLKNTVNPYGLGGASEKILTILKNLSDFKSKKVFFDI